MSRLTNEGATRPRRWYGELGGVTRTRQPKWTKEHLVGTTTRVRAKVVLVAAVPIMLTFPVSGCEITEPVRFESIVGNWTGSGGGLRLEVSFDAPECGYICVGSGSGSWIFEPAGEAGTITSIDYVLPMRSEMANRLVTGDTLNIGLVDFPNGVCLRFLAVVLSDRTLAGQVHQECGGMELQIKAINTYFTLIKR